MADLFKKQQNQNSEDYSASDIEVLEGLEPVRHRPGMYIGGTDERAFHHLVAEILDNSMDEAVAGHASRIEILMLEDGFITIKDNGRGIPIDPHPKYKDKSALEVILTTLHSGGKFSGKAYATSGGLHGVGISVVNALSESLTVEVARDKKLYSQSFSRGLSLGSINDMGTVNNRRGTMVTFKPDHEIFGKDIAFKPWRLFKMARSKAYLFKGVEIRWSCPASLIKDGDETPENAILHFPGGLCDFLTSAVGKRQTLTPRPFSGEMQQQDGVGKVEWAIHWAVDGDGFNHTYCNTVPTSQGGSHDSALKSSIGKGIRTYGELVGNKRAAQITGDDVMGEASCMMSIFIADPQFQGQTKERLSSPEATKLVETAIKDRFDHWLAEDPASSNDLLDRVIERLDERLKRRQAKEMQRKAPTKRLRLPGKLADCSAKNSDDTEIFLVEGDSAGGSAKQARNRKTQAILPLRGKILNVASASSDKLYANQELKDLIQALGCGTRDQLDLSKLRYERVIIMTDADVDGAHIAALLMTFFYQEMLEMVKAGRLYLAMPPLYRLTQSSKSFYAMDDAHKDEIMKNSFKGKGKIDVSRFKGLGEMPPRQLKETTMDPSKRTLVQIKLPDINICDNDFKNDNQTIVIDDTANMVETLMGKKPEKRFRFIQDNAEFIDEIDI